MSYHYKAFISYKHDPVDSEIASEIQTRLERFHIPRALQKEKGIRMAAGEKDGSEGTPYSAGGRRERQR